jgi:RNA polymerase sigma-70 factor (ECF subfamily)
VSEGETTGALLQRVRRGDDEAKSDLVARYLPALQRWARGRLPRFARDLADTDDLVQVTLLRALDHVETFEPRERGAFLAYMRRILMNQIRDEVRRVQRQSARSALPEHLTAPEPSPLAQAIGAQQVETYERALDRLAPEQKEAVIMRIEFDSTWSEIATAIGSPSPNAARMLVSRALARLAEEMDAGA